MRNTLNRSRDKSKSGEGQFTKPKYEETKQNKTYRLQKTSSKSVINLDKVQKLPIRLHVQKPDVGQPVAVMVQDQPASNTWR